MPGDAQIIVLIILVQRIIEAVYAALNTRRLLAEGAVPAERDLFPVIAVTQLAWLAAIFLMVPAEREIAWPLLAIFILIQAGRYWVVALIGRYWTLRLVVPQEAPLVTAGPFRYLAHPYYALAMLETFMLPLVFEAWAISVVMSAVTGAVLWHQIGLEEETLEPRRTA